MNDIPILCDNESVIKITYNPYEHSTTKHINIRHHFLRETMPSKGILLSHMLKPMTN
jgi:hypothetical protein